MKLNKKMTLFVLIMIVASMTFAGCGSKNNKSNKKDKDTENSTGLQIIEDGDADNEEDVIDFEDLMEEEDKEKSSKEDKNNKDSSKDSKKDKESSNKNSKDKDSKDKESNDKDDDKDKDNDKDNDKDVDKDNDKDNDKDKDDSGVNVDKDKAEFGKFF